MRVIPVTRTRPHRPSARALIRSLQVGMNWYPDQPGSGVDRMFYGLMRHLPGAGVAVEGVIQGEITQSHGHALRSATEADRPLLRRMWGFDRTIRAAVQAGRVDLVAIHFGLHRGAFGQWRPEVPIVTHFHGPWAHESRAEGDSSLRYGVKYLIERLAYRSAARYITLSDAFRTELVRHYRVPEEQVRVVPGGVDVDRFDVHATPEAARAALGWPADRPTVVTVRRLARRMGLENLIRSVREVATRVPDVVFQIVGRGALHDELGRRIDEAQLHDHVRLVGFVPDEQLPLAYRAANLSVVPSVALEGFGLTTVESLAAGTPVLVTPVGGLPEVVRGLSEELILESSRPEAIAAGIAESLTGERLVPSAGECRSFARTHYDWPVIAERTRAVYEEVIS